MRNSIQIEDLEVGIAPCGASEAVIAGGEGAVIIIVIAVIVITSETPA